MIRNENFMAYLFSVVTMEKSFKKRRKIVFFQTWGFLFWMYPEYPGYTLDVLEIEPRNFRIGVITIYCQNISEVKKVQFYFSQTIKSLFQKNTLTIELKIDKVNAVAH